MERREVKNQVSELCGSRSCPYLVDLVKPEQICGCKVPCPFVAEAAAQEIDEMFGTWRTGANAKLAGDKLPNRPGPGPIQQAIDQKKATVFKEDHSHPEPEMEYPGEGFIRAKVEAKNHQILTERIKRDVGSQYEEWLRAKLASQYKSKLIDIEKAAGPSDPDIVIRFKERGKIHYRIYCVHSVAYSTVRSTVGFRVSEFEPEISYARKLQQEYPEARIQVIAHVHNQTTDHWTEQEIDFKNPSPVTTYFNIPLNKKANVTVGLTKKAKGALDTKGDKAKARKKERDQELARVANKAYHMGSSRRRNRRNKEMLAAAMVVALIIPVVFVYYYLPNLSPWMEAPGPIYPDDFGIIKNITVVDSDTGIEVSGAVEYYSVYRVSYPILISRVPGKNLTIEALNELGTGCNGNYDMLIEFAEGSPYGNRWFHIIAAPNLVFTVYRE